MARNEFNFENKVGNVVKKIEGFGNKGIGGYSEILDNIPEYLNFGYGLAAGKVFHDKMGLDMPIYVKRKDDVIPWRVPFDPQLTITGKNSITKRNILKSRTRGTIKERWSQDDYVLSMKGVLIGKAQEGQSERRYPYAEVSLLRRYFEAKQELFIFSPVLEIFNIHRIVVTDLTIPPSHAGDNDQVYEIKAVSDSSYTLLLNDDSAKKSAVDYIDDIRNSIKESYA